MVEFWLNDGEKEVGGQDYPLYLHESPGHASASFLGRVRSAWRRAE
jgi:hypothetical protein